MKHILHTNRLSLRQFSPELDAQNCYELNADPEVMRYTGDLSFSSVQASREFLENYDAYQRTGMGRWAVCDRKTGEFLGWCGLKQHDDYVDLGYRFHRSHWGKGYATEAALACVHYGFSELGLEQIVGRTAAENPGSIRVLEKCGMYFWKKDSCEGIENSLYYRIRSEDIQ